MLYFVYAYDMYKAEELDMWCQLLCHRVLSYWDNSLEATWEVTRLINEDDSNPRECFAVGAVPTGACHEHNLI